MSLQMDFIYYLKSDDFILGIHLYTYKTSSMSLVSFSISELLKGSTPEDRVKSLSFNIQFLTFGGVIGILKLIIFTTFGSEIWFFLSLKIRALLKQYEYFHLINNHLNHYIACNQRLLSGCKIVDYF